MRHLGTTWHLPTPRSEKVMSLHAYLTTVMFHLVMQDWISTPKQFKEENTNISLHPKCGISFETNNQSTSCLRRYGSKVIHQKTLLLCG